MSNHDVEGINYQEKEALEYVFSQGFKRGIPIGSQPLEDVRSVIRRELVECSEYYARIIEDNYTIGICDTVVKLFCENNSEPFKHLQKAKNLVSTLNEKGFKTSKKEDQLLPSDVISMEDQAEGRKKNCIIFRVSYYAR